MKLGLFGGTFNPVHFGHLINAQMIREAYSLDRILFIPSKHPVHKELEGNISPEDRYNMVRIAVDDNPFFEVSRIEMDRDADSYFIITVKDLLAVYPDAGFFLILGIDAFNEIHKWKDSKELLNMISCIVMKRPGIEKINKKVMKTAGEVKLVENPLVEISSSMIRDNIKNNKSIRYLVPPGVEEYILTRGLYSS